VARNGSQILRRIKCRYLRQNFHIQYFSSCNIPNERSFQEELNSVKIKVVSPMS
jgi:hypothetical protein